jgi:hypothetical protein
MSIMEELSKSSVIISLISAAAACIAIAISFVSYRVSKKSLAIYEKQYLKSVPDIDLYLNEGFTETSNDKSTRYYVFSVTITNRSSENNSLALVEMNIYCSNDEGFMSKIVIPHEPGALSLISMPDLTMLPSNVDFNPAEVKSGWVLFKIDRGVLRNKKIDSYKLEFSDSRNNKYELEPIIIKEIHKNREVEKKENSD